MKMKCLLIVLMLCSISWCAENPTIEKFFMKFGQYQFQNQNGYDVVKSYYSSRHLRLHWIDAYVLCRTFNMDLVELPTEAEANYFLSLCAQQELKGDFFHIGGSYVGLGLNEFYWMTTGQRINYTLKYAPGQPDNMNGIERYLSINEQPGSYKFNDVDNGVTKWKFICQRITKTNDNDSSIDERSKLYK